MSAGYSVWFQGQAGSGEAAFDKAGMVLDLLQALVALPRPSVRFSGVPHPAMKGFECTRPWHRRASSPAKVEAGRIHVCQRQRRPRIPVFAGVWHKALEPPPDGRPARIDLLAWRPRQRRRRRSAAIRRASSSRSVSHSGTSGRGSSSGILKRLPMASSRAAIVVPCTAVNATRAS